MGCLLRQEARATAMLCEVWKPLNQDVTDIEEDVLVPENETCEVSLKSF